VPPGLPYKGIMKQAEMILNDVAVKVTNTSIRSDGYKLLQSP
jgi:hypothetical protein